MELGQDTDMTVVKFTRRIGNKPMTYNNYLPVKNKTLLSGMQLKCVEYIVVARDITNLYMSRK